MVTISGTPTTSVGSPFTYTVTTTGGCPPATTTGIITVTQKIIPTITTVAATCSQSGSSTITNYNAALTYTFTPSGPSIGINGLITGMVTGTNYTVVSNNGGCVSSASSVFSIVAQLPNPTFTATFTKDICSGSSTDIVLTSSTPGITYEWTATATHLPGYITQGTGASINQILTTDAVIGTINISVIPKLGSCVGTPYSISIFVHENPKINSISFEDNQICSGELIKVTITGEPNGIVYDWVAVPNGVQLSGGITSGTTTNGSIIIGATSINTTVAGTVTFNITPRRTVGVSTCYGPMVTSGIVTVNPIPGTPFSAAASDEICSGNNPTLSVQVTPFITGNTANWTIVQTNGVTVSGAEFGNGASFPLTFPNTVLTTTANIQGFVKIRVTTILGDCVGGTTDFIVKVNPRAPIGITDHYVCVNQLGQTTVPYLLDTGLGAMSTNYEFEWYTVSTTGINTLITGETEATYMVPAPGKYMVLVRDLRYSTECEATKTVTITTVTQAEEIDYTVTEAFSSNGTITVLVNSTGTGHLIYSLNDGPWQDSNVFENLGFGEYRITVSDTEGCTYLTTIANIIDYPRFFTPNGDGFNDTWNVMGVKSEHKAIIYIFDRFGKLIKQLSPTGNGWDGTYNGEMLPSTDYWFSIDYTENNTQKNFKAHFSLKR
jgi:gliding motility-associated-like protein